MSLDGYLGNRRHLQLKCVPDFGGKHTRQSGKPRSTFFSQSLKVKFNPASERLNLLVPSAVLLWNLIVKLTQRKIRKHFNYQHQAAMHHQVSELFHANLKA